MAYSTHVNNAQYICTGRGEQYKIHNTYDMNKEVVLPC